jgi:Spy/CpxP family protein refolding chaperone
LYRRRTGRNVRLQMPRTPGERANDNAAEGSSSKQRESVPSVERIDPTTKDKLIMTTRFASRIAAVAAAALIGVAGVASAQPHHGHGGPGGGDFVMGIAALKGQLNLNTSQQAMWDNAVAAGKAARESARASHQQVQNTLTNELAKAEPDLAAVAASADAAHDAAQAQLRQVRAAWLNLYSTFTPDQKAVVKNAMQQRLTRMEQFREKMKQRHGS